MRFSGSTAMLNEEQQRAVHTTEGHVLVLAGAGSGKTSVITHRIAHLIQDKKIPSSAILGLTFTNKAAEEMLNRVSSMISVKDAKLLQLSTFHRFCMRVLRKHIFALGFTSTFSLYNEKEVRRLLNQLAREELSHDGDLPSLETVIGVIAEAKNNGIHPDLLQTDALSKTLYHKLQIAMRACNAVDFDSLLFLTLQLFEEHPSILELYQTQFRYIMIDEYQDTNMVQYRLSKLLSEKHKNLCVVGDDDQAIYGWRGADIKNILQFTADTTIKLEQNYRSTPTILEAANRVIQNNTERHAKNLWSAKSKGSPIEVFHAPSEEEEAAAVIDRMIWYHSEKNIPWGEMAILYRSNLLAKPFEMALMQASWNEGGTWKRGIPYQVIGGTEFSARSEVKDLLAYLRVMINPQDQEAILRIINVPRRGVSDDTLDTLTKKNRSLGISLWEVLETIDSCEGISERGVKGIHNFMRIIKEGQEKIKSPPFSDTLRWLTETVNYQKAIHEEVKSEKMREFKWENITTLIDSVDQYPDIQEFITSLTLDESSFPKSSKSKSKDQTTLMTFHGAKGLEFTVCFLVGLEDQIMPHEKSVVENGLEEERRLMYVAMTRAKKQLVISMSRNRMRHGKKTAMSPSRFLFEIPKELIEIKSFKWLPPLE
ncbi:MAG: UvrD-helicase domain-containing protein [Candidatus Rhabdochlamydia sp.]